MHRRQVIHLLLMVLIGTAILLPIALVIHWFPVDASKQSHNDRILYDVLLIASVPIFVIVESVVLYSVWNFRMRPGEEAKDGAPIHGNTRLEVVWTAAPALLIVGLCIYAYSVLRSDEKTYPTARLINVTERQFAFEFSYPMNHGKQYVVSPDLYLPNNQPALFELRSLDVIHSFFVPDFSQKIDAVPGITTTLRVTPTRLGTYAGRVHRAVRSRPRIHAQRRSRADAGRVQLMAAVAETRRSGADRSPGPDRGPVWRAGRREHLRFDLDVIKLEQLAVLVIERQRLVIFVVECERLELRRLVIRRRESSLHLSRVCCVPHAGRRRRDRHRRPEPGYATQERLRDRRLEGEAGRIADRLHPYRDRRPIQVPSVGIPRRDHAVDVRQVPVHIPDPGTCHVPGHHGKVKEYR